MENNIRSFKSKYGWITLKENKNKLISCKFEKLKNHGDQKFIKKTQDKINKFLSGEKVAWNIETMQSGTPLQVKVWDYISKIHYGEVVSYNEIAKSLKTSPRFVGTTCGKNNILLIVPCHRIIRSDGKLGGYAAPTGIELKKKLLANEWRT